MSWSVTAENSAQLPGVGKSILGIISEFEREQAPNWRS